MSELRVPEDVEAERSLIATLCRPGMEALASELVNGLAEEDFVLPKTRATFTALKALLRRGSEVHLITLRDELARLDMENIVEGIGGLSDLLASEEVGRPRVLAEILTRKTAQRRLIRVASRLARDASEGELDPEHLSQVASLAVLRASAARKGFGDVLQAHEIAGDMAAREEEELGPSVRIPFPMLDSMLGGLHPGNIVVLAARPGMGKTALATQVALHAARNRGRVGIWSLEMSREEVLDRLVCQLRLDGPRKLQPGWARRRLDDRERAVVLMAKAELAPLTLTVCDDALTTPSKIRAAAAQARAKGEPYHLIVVDYLQLMVDEEDKGARGQNEAVRVAKLSRALKVLAKEMQVPILVLSQLNREVETRKGAPPQLSDLRDSGAIEQDADSVLFIHRKVVDSQPEDEGLLIAAKNRHGRPGRVFVEFVAGTMSFRELDKGTAAPPPPEAPALAEWG